MLRRFADARLRRDLAKAENARDQARDCARRLFRRLQDARAEAATNRALMERWRLIAQGAQEELTALRTQGRPRPHLEAVKARADRLAAALAESMRTQSVADVSVAAWARWEALLAEHAEQQKETTP